MPLTDPAIRNAKPGEKPIRLFDGGGLYLEVAPSGGKWWRFKYRFAGKEKRLSLGVYPEVTRKEDRAKRDDVRKQLATGTDPGETRKIQKLVKIKQAQNSFEAVAREWYQKQLHTWVSRHADDVLRRLEANLFPDLGRRPLDELDSPELVASLGKIEKRGAYDLAHRVWQVSGQVPRYGIASGYCKRDIALSNEV